MLSTKTCGHFFFNFKPLFDFYCNFLDNERLWRCNGLTRFGADSQKFKLDDGSTCLVSDYFQKHYKIKLKFPHMPCIIVGNVKEGRAKYFPMELMMVGPRQRSPGTNEIIKKSRENLFSTLMLHIKFTKTVKNLHF